MLLARGAIVAPVLFVYGATLDGQRLDDRKGPLAIDREMDARIADYVRVVDASQRAMTLETDVRVAGMWAEGRRSGRLHDPMPARYGDDDEGLGVRSEVIQTAFRLSTRLLHRAAQCQDAGESRRLFAAGLEPLRTVQYADAATFAIITVRRGEIAHRMRGQGFSAAQAEATTAILRPDRAKLSALYGHMASLRDRYRERYDETDLWQADPAFETVVRGERRATRLVARS